MRTRYFTGQGDKGKSKMGKKNLPKHAPVFEILGGLDLLNSWIGFARVEAERGGKRRGKKKIDVAKILFELQEFLFIAQAEVAAFGGAFGKTDGPRIVEGHIRYFEDVIFVIDRMVPPLTKFIVPGGCELSARLDLARALARQEERRVAAHAEPHGISPEFLMFYNRLSSLLFALARYANWESGAKERNPTYKK